MQMIKPHEGTQGEGKMLEKCGVSWLQYSIGWADSQELIMVAALVAGAVLI